MIRRVFLITLILGLLAACGEAQTAATVAPTAGQTTVAQANVTAAPPTSAAAPATAGPSATPRPTRTPAPTPSPLPVASVPPEITSAPAELDTPSLSENNAPPTSKPEDKAVGSGTQPVRLVIDAIGVDAEPVSVGLDSANIPIVPKHDVGWYNLSAQPGQGENVVFWGHVLRWKDAPKVPAPFARLKEAGVGTPLTVYTADGAAHEYVVTEQVWVTPDQVQYILPVGSERVTLVSCIGDKVIQNGSVELSHRLITIAEPVE
jgi:sortase (surface protein transpeptidase)